MPQNKTEILLSHIHDYQKLLGFLYNEYPQILEIWINKSAVGTNPQQQTQDGICQNNQGDDYSDTRVNT